MHYIQILFKNNFYNQRFKIMKKNIQLGKKTTINKHQNHSMKHEVV